MTKKNDPPHVALAKARILSDLRYLDTWKADLIRDIMLLEKPDDSPVYSKKGLFRDGKEGLPKRDTEDEGDV
tara:strand:+ start:204 stop:419 length:216 start_codon:yes stop_codon:yes gene_type:complete